jgi:hypothetical protein
VEVEAERGAGGGRDPSGEGRAVPGWGGAATGTLVAWMWRRNNDGDEVQRQTVARPIEDYADWMG